MRYLPDPKRIPLLAGGLLLLTATGCLVTEERGHWHGRHEVRSEVRVVRPEIIVRPPEIIVR